MSGFKFLHFQTLISPKKEKSNFDSADINSYLLPLFGKQDEAVIVNQETVQILDGKQQKEARLFRSFYKIQLLYH